MNKKMFWLFFLFCGGIHGQMRVHDDNRLNQLKSMEFLQWKFSPNWYYYSWYREKFLGVSIKMAGLGIHDRGVGGTIGGDGYVSHDKRNILQEIPMIAAVNYQKNQTEIQGDKTDIVYKNKLKQFADRTIDSQYLLTQSERLIVIGQVTSVIEQYRNNGGNTKNIILLSFELSRIMDNISITKKSHLSSSQKREMYLQYHKELQELFGLASRLNYLKKITL